MDRRSSLVSAFLLGAVTAMGFALVSRQDSVLTPAYGQAASGGSKFALVTGTGTSGQSRDVLFLFDEETRRLAVYEYKDSSLSLGAVRNIEYELRFETWSPRGKDQQPTVKEMKKASEEDKNKKG
jgi:hypothetical protein